MGINGERFSPAEALKKLNELGGRHGIGRVDLVENRFVGMKSRGVYGLPEVQYCCRLSAVETLTMDRDLMHLRDSLVPKYAELVYYGFGTLRNAKLSKPFSMIARKL